MDASSQGSHYDAHYYLTGCGRDYHRDDYWLKFFGDIARRIVQDLRPRTVLDAGCAMGYLVECLRQQGVEAWGVDISDYAISQVHPSVRPYCRVGSIAEPFERHYDLITCVEVLEHMPPAEGLRALENFCRHSDDVLFSSTPLDYKEATHYNVQPTEYWVEQFARYGFYRDVDFDSRFLTPWSLRFRRGREPVGRTLAAYQRRLWQLQQENEACRQLLVEERAELARRLAQINEVAGLVPSLRKQVAEGHAQLQEARARSARLEAHAAALLPQVPYRADLPPGQGRAPFLGARTELVPWLPFRQVGVDLGGPLHAMLWQFAPGGGHVTFRVDLAPGRYHVTGRGVAAESATLHLSARGGPRAQVGPLGPRPHQFTMTLDLATRTRELVLWSAPDSGPAWVVGLGLSMELAEPTPVRLRRNLAAWARQHGPTRLLGRAAKRILRSPLVQSLRRATGLVRTPPAPPPAAPPDPYPAWREERLRARRTLYAATPRPGLFSLLTTVWDTPLRYLEPLAQSVLGQRDYPCFEWVVLDNGSTNPETLQFLARLVAQPQVRLQRVEKNLGIVGGMRNCLDRATGRYVVPVDSDDLLTPDCLEILAWHVERHGHPALLYSDEDLLAEDRFTNPYLKPGWDPVLFLNHCYIAHLGAVDRRLAVELDAYGNAGANGSHDWDTFMRLLLAGHQPVHVPEVLYSWRMHAGSCAGNMASKSYVGDSHRHVLGKFLAAQAHPERYQVAPSPLLPGGVDWYYRRTRTDPRPLLTVVLSTDPDKVDAEELRQATGYPCHRVEAISLGDGLADLARHARGAAAEGGLVHLVLDGVRMQGDEWPWEALTLTELHPDVAMVGGRVLSAANTVVTAGEYFGSGGDCGCPDAGRSSADPGYFAHVWKQRSVSAASTMLAVADAVFLVDFLEHGGHPRLSLPFLGAWAGAYAARKGKRVVYSPHMTGTLAAPVDWNGLVRPEERAAFVQANRDLLPERRYFSRHLSLDPARPYGLVSPAEAGPRREAA
jgi:hypothetical protein